MPEYRAIRGNQRSAQSDARLVYQSDSRNRFRSALDQSSRFFFPPLVPGNEKPENIMLSTCPSGLSHFQYWLIVEKWRFVVLMLRRATGRLDRSARSIESSGYTIVERLFPCRAGRRCGISRTRPGTGRGTWG